jgi:Fe-S-cluster-containing hydrogenase component 2
MKETGTPALVIECPERIACDLCENICCRNVITVDGSSINTPRIAGLENCSACALCVAHCPGHAIFLVDNDWSADDAKITVPFELNGAPAAGTRVYAVDGSGARLGEVKVIRARSQKIYNKTTLLELAASKTFAGRIRGIEHAR